MPNNMPWFCINCVYCSDKDCSYTVETENKDPSRAPPRCWWVGWTIDVGCTRHLEALLHYNANQTESRIGLSRFGSIQINLD